MSSEWKMGTSPANSLIGIEGVGENHNKSLVCRRQCFHILIFYMNSCFLSKCYMDVKATFITFNYTTSLQHFLASRGQNKTTDNWWWSILCTSICKSAKFYNNMIACPKKRENCLLNRPDDVPSLTAICENMKVVKYMGP